MGTVVVGSGIIGVSTAYYLCKSGKTPPFSIHLIESTSTPFASASGFAAGFLARDWFSSSVASLGELSFNLHKKLAEENNGWKKWGYSRSTGISLAETGGQRGDDWLREGTSRADAAGVHEFVDANGPTWLTRRNGRNIETISEGASTAQVFVPCLHTYINVTLHFRPQSAKLTFHLAEIPSASPNSSSPNAYLSA